MLALKRHGKVCITVRRVCAAHTVAMDDGSCSVVAVGDQSEEAANRFRGVSAPVPFVLMLYLYYAHTEQHMFAIRLPEDIESRLTALAQATGRTKAFYVREAILKHLDKMEELYLAEQRLIDLRAGRTRTVPIDEVMTRKGLD